MTTQEEKEPIAESGIWTLKCRCGNIYTIPGQKILEHRDIICPHCDRCPNRIILQNVVRPLIEFQKALKEATKQSDGYETWEKITPPPASWKIFEN